MSGEAEAPADGDHDEARFGMRWQAIRIFFFFFFFFFLVVN